jgi:hypothetical protein
VTVTSIREVTNKKHQVTEVIVIFSGAVNAAEADNPALYRLALPGKKGSYTARNARLIKLKSASYNAATGAVALTPGKPFALTRPVQLVIDGLPPSGLQDRTGRFIDGGHTGTAGGNAVAILSRGGVAIDAMTPGTTGGQAFGIAAVVDTLLEAGDLTAGTLLPRRQSRSGFSLTRNPIGQRRDRNPVRLKPDLRVRSEARLAAP